jgi:hypothetical protein
VEDDYIVEKIAGNQYDPVTQKVYNLKYSPPPEPIYSRLLQRQKEAEVAIHQRLNGYHRNIGGVISCFKDVVRQVNVPEIFGKEEEVARELQAIFEVDDLDDSPRAFKLVVAGLSPGWNALVCEHIEKSFSLVHGKCIVFYIFQYIK